MQGAVQSLARRGIGRQSHATGDLPPTSDGDLGNAAPLVLHLAEVDAVVVGAGIADRQAPQHASLLHHVLVAGLQLPVLQVPGSGDGLQRHLALQHSILPLRHLHVCQLYLEPQPVLCHRERWALRACGARHPLSALCSGLSQLANSAEPLALLCPSPLWPMWDRHCPREAHPPGQGEPEMGWGDPAMPPASISKFWGTQERACQHAMADVSAEGSRGVQVGDAPGAGSPQWQAVPS